MEVAGGNYTTTHRFFSLLLNHTPTPPPPPHPPSCFRPQRPTLRLQYCPLRIKKIQNFEEEHKHIFSQGTSTCQILRHLDMDPMTLHQLYYIADDKLVDEGRTFDAVLALEVIQHVANPANPCQH
ncbi:uncharacterized protein LOC103867930 [Brassica rapa]|uniref:uncharacterized protein LOC103867930 n=1 Tax=Brassica campestris TaxID=3711 RepID=UPI00142D7E69|nr:uncharacterized protein LOC103867930 [Brassica rapa]